MFNMDKLRKDVLGDRKPKFRIHRTRKDTNLYQNSCYESPELDVPTIPAKLPECVVEVLRDECDYWTKIKVFKCEKKNFEGRGALQWQE